MQAVKKTTLANGVRVITRKIPHVRSISMGVWVNAGSRDELPEEGGISHFIEHMLFKGTTTRSAYKLAKDFDAIGGQTNAFTTAETTCYHARALDSHLPKMVELLSDIFLNSEFDERETENERAVILQEIGMVEDTPEDYIHTLSEKQLWGDHSLGRSILGTEETISSLTGSKMRSFFKRQYQPDRIIISAAGNIDHDHFINLVAHSFESVKSTGRFPERTAPVAQSTISLHTRDIEQVHINLCAEGTNVTSPYRFAASLMNTIMGGNMSSRLFQEIREKRGLAYSVYSYLASNEDSGISGIYLAVSPDNAQSAIDLVIDEMHKLKEHSVSISELKDAKEFAKGNILLSSESTDNHMARLAQNEMHFGRSVPLQEVIDNIEAVTPEEIAYLTDAIFHGKKPILTLLGPVKNSSIFNNIMDRL